MDRLRRIGVVVAALAVAAWAVGCASGTTGSGALGAPAMSSKPVNRGLPQKDASSATTDISTLQPDATFPQIGPKVVKTADVNLAVPKDRLQSRLQQAIQVAGRYQGFVVSTTLGSTGPDSGTVVMRIPASRFESALGDLKGLGKVTRTEVSGQDVSQDFIDLQARLRNANAQEAVMLRLMNRANSISETIQVEQQLQNVELEMERLKGQLRYLDDQSSMGTITVGLSPIGLVVHEEGSIPKAWHQAASVLVGLVAAVIVGIGYLVPIGLIALIALLILRRWRPRLTA